MRDKNTAVTKKGAKTRRRVVEEAKNLFYHKGYSATSIMDICEAAEIKPGTMTYYFNTKYDLVRELYESVFQRSYDFVEQMLGRPANGLEKNTIVAFLYYHGVCADENTRRFHLEILKKSSISDYISAKSLPVARQIVTDLNVGFSGKELEYAELAWNGVSRELFMNFLKNPMGRTVQDVINTIYIFRARLLTADENEMKIYLYNGMTFSHNFDHSHITLLGPDTQPMN